MGHGIRTDVDVIGPRNVAVVDGTEVAVRHGVNTIVIDNDGAIPA